MRRYVAKMMEPRYSHVLDVSGNIDNFAFINKIFRLHFYRKMAFDDSPTSQFARVDKRV